MDFSFSFFLWGGAGTVLKLSVHSNTKMHYTELYLKTDVKIAIFTHYTDLYIITDFKIAIFTCEKCDAFWDC